MFVVACVPGTDKTPTPAPLVPPSWSVQLVQPSGRGYAGQGIDFMVAVDGGTPDAVDLMLDGQVLTTLNTPYHFHWDTSLLPEATHQVSARLSAGTKQITTEPHDIVIDHTAPTLVSQLPAPDAGAVRDTDSIEATFSEPLAPASVTDDAVVLSADGVAVPKTLSLSEDGRVLKVSASATYPLTAHVELTVNEKLTDLAGNPIQTRTWHWTVPGWSAVDLYAPLYFAQRLETLADGRLTLTGAGSALGGSTQVEVDGGWVTNDFGEVLFGVGTYDSSVRSDPQGHPVVVGYSEYQSSDSRWTTSVYVVRGAQEGGYGYEFLADPLLKVDGGSGMASALAFTPDGKPVALFGVGPEPLRAHVFSGSSWVDGVTFASGSAPYGGLQLEFDASGKAVSAWRDDQSHLYVMREGDAAPTDLRPLVPTGTAYPKVELAVAKNGAIYALVGTDYALTLFKRSSDGWHPFASALSPAPYHKAVSHQLSLDSAGNPVVAWVDSALRVERWTGTAWEAITFPGVPVGSVYGVTLCADWRGRVAVSLDGTGLQSTLYRTLRTYP